MSQRVTAIKSTSTSKQHHRTPSPSSLSPPPIEMRTEYKQTNLRVQITLFTMECGVRSTHQHIVLDGVFTWKCITWHWYKYKSDAALGYRDYNFRFDWKQCCTTHIQHTHRLCCAWLSVCSPHPMNMLASKEGSPYSNIMLLANAASALICCLKLQLRPFHWCHNSTKWFVVHAKPLLFAMLTTYCSIITDRRKKNNKQ